MSKMWAGELFAAVVIVCIIVSLSVKTLQAQERSPAPSPVEVNRLLERLGAKERLIRKSAEEQLINLGTGVLELLPGTDQVSDPETREALQRIRTTLDEQLTRDAFLPPRITIRGTYGLKDVLSLVEKQTGNRVGWGESPRTLPSQRREVRLAQRTFWETMQKLEEVFRVRMAFDYTQGGVCFVSANQAALPAVPRVLDGPYLWQWERVSTSSGSKLETVKNLVRSRLLLAIEPRLKGLFVTFSPSKFRLQEDAGDLLKPLNPEASFEIPFGEGSNFVRVEIEYVLPEKKNLLRLSWEGEFQAWIAARQIRFDLARPQFSEGNTQRRGEVEVSFLPIKDPADGVLHVPLLVKYDHSGPAFESHRLWIFRNRAVLKIDDKHEVLPQECDTKLQQKNLVELEYTLKTDHPLRDKSTFSYFAPTRIVSQPLKFQFVRDFSRK